MDNNKGFNIIEKTKKYSSIICPSAGYAISLATMVILFLFGLNNNLFVSIFIPEEDYVLNPVFSGQKMQKPSTYVLNGLISKFNNENERKQFVSEKITKMIGYVIDQDSRVAITSAGQQLITMLINGTMPPPTYYVLYHQAQFKSAA